MMNTIRHILVPLFLAMLSWSMPARADQPNIIFIMADDLGIGDVGRYGQRDIQTPGIDAIGEEGMTFTQFYAGTTVCAPSRSSLVEGKHTGHTRIRGNTKEFFGDLLDEDITFGEILQDAGYTTAAIGKWGVGTPGGTGHPNRQGFDYFFGFLDQSLARFYYPEYVWENETQVPLNGESYIHDLFTEKARDFITTQAARPEPFFLYLPYTVPHKEIDVPSEAPYADEDWPEVERKFAAMVTRMDTDIAELIALLESLGIDDNTIVFFTSDNGPHNKDGHDEEFFDSNGIYRGLKRDLYEGGIRMPMVVRWPGRIAPGSWSDLQWAAWDVLPTLAELAGVPAPEGIDGLSVLPTLEGRPQAERHDHLYWEFHEGGFHQAIRRDDWKAVRRTSPDNPVELYDLAADPGESRNVAGDHPDVVADMEALFIKSRTPSEYWPTELDDEVPAPEVPEGVLVGHWPFDGDADDVSGYDRHGQLVGGASFTDSGRIDGALTLDDDSDHVRLPTVLDPAAVDAFSAAAWVRPDNVAGNYQTLLQQAGDTGRSWLYRESDTGALATYLGGAVLLSESELPIGDWAHAAVTWDGARLRLYLDGELEASAERSLESSSGTLLVGRHKNPSDKARDWHGAVDDLRLYTRALTVDEIQTLAAGDAGPDPDPNPDPDPDPPVEPDPDPDPPDRERAASPRSQPPADRPAPSRLPEGPAVDRAIIGPVVGDVAGDASIISVPAASWPGYALLLALMLLAARFKSQRD